MKNIFSHIIAGLMAIVMMVTFTGCGETTVEVAPEKIKDKVSLSVWGASEDQDVIKELCENFKAKYPDAKIEISVNIESESTVKDTIRNDVTSAADVYCYASDQIYELYDMDALACIDEHDDALVRLAGKSVEDVKNANTESSVAAAQIDGKLYGFPRAGDNGFFLYYDVNAIDEKDTHDFDTLLAVAEKTGKKVGMTFNSGWYISSFFYAAGFDTKRQADGTTEIKWNGTSETGFTGVDVVQSMLKIAESPAFEAIPDGRISDEIASGEYLAVISGTWDANVVEETWGANYGATKLPTFTCAGEQLQMGDSAGFKFLGVNPEAENVQWAIALAEFMSNEDAQKLYFEKRKSGPTNINAANSSAVKNDKAISAIVEQNGAAGYVLLVGEDFWKPICEMGEQISKLSVGTDDRLAIQAFIDGFMKRVKEGGK